MALDLSIVDEVVEGLRRARRVLFVTGAGVSADSGLPTYRGIGGLYERETTEDGIPIEVALSGQMMANDPALCWKYIHQIERACRGARPNLAHEVIAGLEEHVGTVVVLTQNVDGLHRDAGSSDLIEIHGNIHDLRCTRGGHEYHVGSYAEIEIPPLCPRCGGPVRPRVVLFGEMLPGEEVARLSRALDRGFDIVFSVGTTSVFPYIAQPIVRARREGKMTVEINPGHSEVTALVTHGIASGAAESLGAIWDRLREP